MLERHQLGRCIRIDGNCFCDGVTTIKSFSKRALEFWILEFTNDGPVILHNYIATISAHRSLIDGCCIGRHKLVVSSLKGVNWLNPPC